MGDANPGPRPKPGTSQARARFWESGNLDIQKFGIPNDSSADPKQIGWRLLAEESWLRTLG